jgi:hypothetical protein|nr:MAG TPA: hypothetical protein [Caudoviricetes sp.]DAS93926.1 MAG TPA: hypothetical protein [Caudoviricetes sp.]
MNEQLSLEELLDLKIKERNYEALIDMILRHLTLLPYNNELYFKDEGEIIKLLELIETRKIGLIREELIRQKEEIKKNKEKEQKDE